MARLKIVALGDDAELPSVLEFSRFLYHVNRVYEITRLASDPQYEGFHFPPRLFPQAFSSLQLDDRLLLDGVRHESPWSLTTSFTLTATAIGAVFGVVQIYESLSDRPLNRDKLQAEVRGQMLSNIEKARQQHVPLTAEERIVVGNDRFDHVLTWAERQWLMEMLERRNALKYYESSSRSLKKLPFRVNDLSVQITEDARR